MLRKVIIFLLLWCSFVEASEYSFVTYNVWYDLPTSAKRIPKLLNIIFKEKADVIALQEVKLWFLDYLENDPRFNNYHLIMEKELNNIQGGLLFLTKKKIESFKYYDLPSNMKRGMLSLRINLNGKAICVITTHLDSFLGDTGLRIKQLKSIFNHSNCDNSILLGDFNFGDGELENSILNKEYVDIWKQLKQQQLGYTWDIKISELAKNNSFPNEESRRLDKIYIKGNYITPINIKIIGNKSFTSSSNKILFPSDHFGVSTKVLIE